MTVDPVPGSRGEINPYASPHVPDPQKPIEDAGIGVWRDGDKIVLHRQAELPPFCLVTGEPAEYGYHFDMSWSYPVDLARRKLRVHVTLSDSVRRLYRARRWAAYSVVAVMLAASGVAIYFDHPSSIVSCLLLTWIAVVPALFIHIRYSELLYFVKVRGNYLWLRGAAWAYLDRLPEWPYGG